MILSKADEVYLVGASELGVQNACWDFLHHLGYRHYAPGPKWEIVPKLDKMDVDLDMVSHPAFATRVIFFGYGILPGLLPSFLEWQKHNRLESGFKLATGHAYGSIVKRHWDEFQRHPEYLAKPLDDQSEAYKFVVANEGLRKLVIDDALHRVKADPALQSVSMDPSDGPGWPESSPLGSISNQAVTLANAVASGLRDAGWGRKVGMYAYSQHSPPPSIPVDPDVIVSVATAFINGGLSFEQLVAQWRAKGAEIGVRDYLAVWPWDHDLPGRSMASSPAKVADNIAKYADLGARYYTAETSYSWVPNGLGHYVAARCLWNPAEKESVDRMRDDFFNRAFGSAHQSARRFYDLIDGSAKPLLADHLLAGMYGALSEAYALADNEDALARLDDLAAYARFVEMFREYSGSTGPQRQESFDRLVRFALRIGEAGVIHTRALLRDVPIRDKAIVLPEDLKPGKAPGREECQQWVKEGMDKYALLDFEPIAFSRDLTPLTSTASSREGAEEYAFRLRGKNSLFTWCAAPGQDIVFSVEGGEMARNTGPVRIRIYPALHPLGESICELEIPADKQPHEVRVSSDYQGLHRVEIDDGGNLTVLRWPRSQALSLPSGQEENVYLNGRYNACFYVPRGAKRVAGYARRATGRVLNAEGVERLDLSELDGPGYFDVAVSEGEDGAVWKLDNGLGPFLLMTVPPWIAPDEEALLVPSETLQK